MTAKKSFSDIMQFRHACKEFDGKKIPKKDLQYILEAGRLSPSSFGMQPWRFIVVQDQKIKEKLLEHSWNQVQVTTCSDLIVVCARTDIKPGDDFNTKVMEQRSLEEHKKGRIQGFLKGIESEPLVIYCQQQCFIACANIMNAAAALKIDSCPMGGFDADAYSKVLGLDPHLHPTILIPVGYRKNDAPKKDRVKFEDVVEIRRENS